MQIRPPSGHAFWSFSKEFIARITIGDFPLQRVCWKEREWFCKGDNRALNEIVGYQIASAINLPIQPWLAFESPVPREIGAGMFIESWNSAHLETSLVGLGAEHSALVARGLALWAFGRYDDMPAWLLSDDTSELRLIDLDDIGPIATVPPHEAPLHNSVSNTESVFACMRAKADKLEITSAFCSEVTRLVAVFFSNAVDLSGFPNGGAHTEYMLSGLQARQRELKNLL